MALFMAVVFLCAVSCREEYRKYDTGTVYLEFSQDTVRFDTVFTTQTSITQRVSVRNPSKNAVSIDRIYLDGGVSSRFRINVSGDTALNQKGVVIGGKDSILIFIHTAIDYRDQNNPFEIIDYIKFELNGMPAQQIVLSAWGQDAYYWESDRSITLPYHDPLEFYEEVDSVKFTYFIWNESEYPVSAQRPYVIYGYLTVPEGTVLRIPAGARFYFAANSGIWIQKGARLLVEGTVSEPVRFTSIRQDGSYRDAAGQWGRIWLSGESGPHRIEYAEIRNGKSGIWLDSCLVSEGGLEVLNTRIENMSSHGIYAQQNRVEGTNLCISETKVNLALFKGGNYLFTHCTFSNDYVGGYGNSQCLVLNNCESGESGGASVYPLARAEFANSIFWGSGNYQLNIDLKNADQTTLKDGYLFRHCLIRYEPEPADTQRFTGCFWNEDPYFANTEIYDFRIDSIASKTVGNGDPACVSGAALTDLNSVSRAIPPTIGAYEYVPVEPFRFRSGRK